MKTQLIVRVAAWSCVSCAWCASLPGATPRQATVVPVSTAQVVPAPAVPSVPPEMPPAMGPVASVAPFRRVVPPSETAAARYSPLASVFAAAVADSGGEDGAAHVYCTDDPGASAAEGCSPDACVMESCVADGCAAGGCGDSCRGGCAGAGGGCCSSCKPAFWEHRSGVFGDYLYAQSTGADVAYAQPRDGIALLGSVPVGAVGVVSPDYESAFRAGGTVRLSRCSSLTATYSQFESHATDAIATTTPNAIHSFLVYPGTVTAFSGSLNAQASYDVDFRLADADYRRVWWATRCTVVNYLFGARFGQLNQDFIASQIISPGTTSVLTDVEFEGGGARFGLDGEHRWGQSGFFWYGRGVTSILTGRLRASYLQTNTFSPIQAATSWQDDRVVPVLEYELGLGWQTAGGGFRVRTGYFVSAWYNMVTTAEYIQAVQTSNYADVNDTMTFDGLATRAEIRW